MIQDFWRGVWEQDVHVIVMLTAEHDGGQRKSHPYWDGQYGSFSVKVDSKRLQALDASTTDAFGDAPNVLIRQITLSGPGGSRRISQLHYSSWPDFGVPTDPRHLLGIVRISRGEVNKHQYSHIEPPVLVHCSAGCGRTGTFCTVDSVVATLEARLRKWQEEIFPAEEDRSVDLITKIVEDFRLQRVSMVQTLRQFVLCYETVLQWFSEWLSDHLREVTSYMDDMEASKAAGRAQAPPSRGQGPEQVKSWRPQREERRTSHGPNTSSR